MQAAQRGARGIDQRQLGMHVEDWESRMGILEPRLGAGKAALRLCDRQ